MDLSIVTTLYSSAAHLEEFHDRISAEAEGLTQDYELILVNDGSPDDSLEIALSLLEKDPKVRVIDLSRNFGHHKAMMTGLGHARGDLVFLIDCDLEEAPELLGTFHSEMKRTGADVVYGVQQARKGGLLERLTGNWFYRLVNLLSYYPVPANAIAARLMTRRYVTALVQHRDREVFLAGLWAITGFEQVPVTVEKGHRGTTTYSLGRKLSVLVNSTTSFSSKPLVFIFYLGCAILLLSSLAALYLIVKALFFGSYLAGWPSLIVSVWLLGGLTVFCMGIIGIYLSKVFAETKDRPYTVVRHVYERPNRG
jgi:putative glycosyltransferase